MKEIYDEVYKYIDNYDEIVQYKIDIIKDQLLNIPAQSKIIDIGCGKGHYLSFLANSGYNVLGVELSTTCCESYLQNLPHLNIDFLEYSSTIEDKYYDICLCMDVLEHISYEDIDKFIFNIARIGGSCLLGVANHSDIFLGEELHLIQQNSFWWKSILEKYFKKVENIFTLENEKFFIFKCASI